MYSRRLRPSQCIGRLLPICACSFPSRQFINLKSEYGCETNVLLSDYFESKCNLSQHRLLHLKTQCLQSTKLQCDNCRHLCPVKQEADLWEQIHLRIFRSK